MIVRRANAGEAPRVTERVYHVICISTYTADLLALDAKVELLKRAGHRRMSRSELIRRAVAAYQI